MIDVIIATCCGFAAGVLLMMFVTGGAIEELYRHRQRVAMGKAGYFRIGIHKSSGERIRPDVRFGGKRK